MNTENDDVPTLSPDSLHSRVSDFISESPSSWISSTCDNFTPAGQIRPNFTSFRRWKHGRDLGRAFADA